MRLFRKPDFISSSLFQEIEQTKAALQAAYNNLEEVVDPDLIDCYIYQVNSVQKRYNYLLRLASGESGGK